MLSKLFGGTLNSIACKHMFLLVAVLVLKLVLLRTIPGNMIIEGSSNLAPLMGSEIGIRQDKFVEVPQIKWGLNNQKISFAKACLTARMLNRTLLMPTLSATLFGKPALPISFDKVFNFDKFNTLCAGFVRLGRYSNVLNRTRVLELRKGSGRKWTFERDLSQLRDHSQGPFDEDYDVIRIVGEHPFWWRDHWLMKDYAKVFECLYVTDLIAEEADRVEHMIRAIARGRTESSSFVAVHMRVEYDWMRHCKNLEDFYLTNQICSSKAEIIQRVGNIQGLKAPVVVYLAAADSLLEKNKNNSSSSLVEDWGEGFLPLEKRTLGVGRIYDKYPYLIQSAIDYQVCLNADIFVGNSFSTFSSLLVLDRTQKMIKMGATNMCGNDARWPSYAYNVPGESNGPMRWNANMSDSSLDAITYGTTHISCI